MHETDRLRFESTLPVAELERATSITTTAERILTVENRKTTFLQLTRADAARSTLIVATSFPTQAVRRLLEKLAANIPHHHFGDTDPSGWDILRCLREITTRHVQPFLMKWRPSAQSNPLTKRDLQILDRLLGKPAMSDCYEALAVLRDSGRRGDFEQETRGPPDIPGWPFYADGRAEAS